MSIPRPQLTIAQLLQASTADAGNTLAALVVGPQYRLVRYGVETKTPGYTFDSGGQVLDYQYYDASDALVNIPATDVVDGDFTRLYGDKLEAVLVAPTLIDFRLNSLSTPNIIKIQTDLVKAADVNDLNANFYERPVAVGDIVYVTDAASTERKRKVTGFKGVDVAASFGTNGAKDDSKALGSTFNPTASTAAFTSLSVPSGMTVALTAGSVAADYDAFEDGATTIASDFGDEFTLTVSIAGAPGVAAVNISTLSGLYSATDVLTSDATGDYNITNAALCGLLVTLTDGAASALTVGQVFKFRIIADYATLDTTNATTSSRHYRVTGTYTGTRDTTYIAKVLTGTALGSNSATGAVIRVSDTNGLEAAVDVNITENTSFALGSYGLTAIFQLAAGTPVVQDALRAGDVYYIHTSAAHASATEFDKIVLDGPAADTAVTATSFDLIVEFRKTFTGVIAKTEGPTEDAWSADADAITVNSALSLNVTTRSSGNEWVPFAADIGTLYPYFRSAVAATASENKIAVASTDDIITNFGTVSIDNDLAYGLSRALSGSQGQTVYGLRTSGPGVAFVASSLAKIESTDAVYAIAALVDTAEEKAAVVAHVEAMSDKSVKNFRRCYLGIDSPGEYTLLDLQEDDQPYTATVVDYGGENLLVTVSQAADLDLLDIDTGDLLELVADDVRYEISSVLSATELLLVAGPAAPVSPAVQIRIIKADTPASQAAYVMAASQALGSRRAVHVWNEDGTATADGETKKIPNKFVACEVAGLRCVLLPQQGLTRTEITTITNAPAMYTRYSQTLLDEVANAGTFIITQDAESGAVYIRHQLTTKTDAGSLYYEDNVGVIIDDISFDLKNILDPIIGKRNVTPRTLSIINNGVNGALMARTTTEVDTESYDIGPALIKFANLAVTVDPVLKDRVKVYVLLTVALPLNNIDVILEAEATADITAA